MTTFNQSKLLKSILFSSLPVLFSYAPTAYAGVETYCQPSFTISSNRYDACSQLPILDPANDNQTNMLLLLSDLGLADLGTIQADKNMWDAVYGTVPFDASTLLSISQNKIANHRAQFKSNTPSYDERCATLEPGQTLFIQQVTANQNISATEKRQLIQERNTLKQCNDKTPLIAVDPTWSVTARQYASYLNGSIAFYNANFSTATKIYSALTQVDDPWLKETSQYMLIRTTLNSAYATGVNPYGDVDLNKINPNILKQFLENITNYLKLYPNGQYVASARGFMRRGFWLSRRQDLLLNELVWQLNNSKSKYYNLEIQNFPAEVDRRVFGTASFDAKNLNDPFFLTIYDLMQMRDSSAEGYHPITWAQLNTQQDKFKNQPALFQYLQATQLFFIQKKPQQALEYLPKTPPDINTYLGLSQAFLKGRILEKTASTQQAANYWNQLLTQSKTANQRGLFEMALSQHLNAQQNYAAFMGKNAKISQINLQKNFITHIANENSLQKIIQSNEATIDQKQTATYILLQKSLAHQNYALFNQYYSAMPPDALQYKAYSSLEKFKNKPPFANFIWNGSSITPQIKCPDLSTLTAKLAQAPQDLTLNLCLGEYMRSDKSYDTQYNTDEATTSSFKGRLFTRGQVYKDIINHSSKGDLQAYALFRAIQCYAPSGNNDCNDPDVPKSTRKQWYDQIKRDYPETSWAKSLKYYW